MFYLFSLQEMTDCFPFLPTNIVVLVQPANQTLPFSPMIRKEHSESYILIHFLLFPTVLVPHCPGMHVVPSLYVLFSQELRN